MSVYRKFGKNDIFSTVIHARPNVKLAWGSDGWRGTTGPSGSLSLYGGVRARTDVKQTDLSTSGLSIYPLDPLDTHSVDKVIFVSGSYPASGTINFVQCTNDYVTTPTQTRWYQEHFRPFSLLYDRYKLFDSNYFLGCHDFYCFHLEPEILATRNKGSYFIFSGAFATDQITSPTSSFTLEAWIKPNSLLRPMAVMSQKGQWSFYVNSTSTNSGTLRMSFVSASNVSVIDSGQANVLVGRWNHVAAVVNGGTSVLFYLNGAPYAMGSIPITVQTGSQTQPLLVGSEVDASWQPSSSFGGFLFETQVWNKARTAADISSSYNETTFASSSQGLVHYARFNDGPLSTASGYAIGTGSLDHSQSAKHGYLFNYGTYTSEWTPNDHPTFVTTYSAINTSLNNVKLFHVPSMYYGKQINPGSVRVVDSQWNFESIQKVFVDDGKGTLYLSGSMTRDVSGEDYTGNTRRKVGNVFYAEGLIVFTDPAVINTIFDSANLYWDTSKDLISLDFCGETTVYTKTFNCRFGPADYNMSNNPTFSYVDDNGTTQTDDDKVLPVIEDDVTYVTAIGLYNEDRQLVAVAKIAQPIRKRGEDKLNVRLKFDF